MNDGQLCRYSRHILLPEIDEAGQETLLRSRALIVGLGGLGSPVAMYLAASGVGTLMLSDPDQVELSNLQRQILHSTYEVGTAKTSSAHTQLAALNPEIKLITLPRRLEGADLKQEVHKANAVIDCSDNFATRFAINAACIAARIPLISGSAIRMKGQVTVFEFNKAISPCYRCLYADSATGDEDTCAQNGVFSPLTGVIGSIQAAETLKVLLNISGTLHGQLLRVDALKMDFIKSQIRPDPYCAVCSRVQYLGLEA